jgi:competence ComEA-like helix-hairpin-helix protein
MTSAESRALHRAAVLVLCLCVVRAALELRQARAYAPGSGVQSEADVLLSESDKKRNDQARRDRPLSVEEKVDPNTADEAELDRLPGVGPSAAKAIVGLRDAGGRFSSAMDLLAVPGIGPATLARMEPFLLLAGEGRGRAPPGKGPPLRIDRGPVNVPSAIDLNRASQKDLEALPGVGPALAGRILALRHTMGGFRTPDDLLRVRGLGPVTVDRLKPLVFVGG